MAAIGVSSSSLVCRTSRQQYASSSPSACIADSIGHGSSGNWVVPLHILALFSFHLSHMHLIFLLSSCCWRLSANGGCVRLYIKCREKFINLKIIALYHTTKALVISVQIPSCDSLGGSEYGKSPCESKTGVTKMGYHTKGYETKWGSQTGTQTENPRYMKRRMIMARNKRYDRWAI